MKKLLYQIIAAFLGLWLAVQFVSGVRVRVYPDSSFFGIPLTSSWHVLLLLGIILGLINSFVKPILKTLTLPLRIITLGLFSLVINLGLIWMVDILFQEITIPWFWSLLYTAVIIWTLNFIIPKLFHKRRGE